MLHAKMVFWEGPKICQNNNLRQILWPSQDSVDMRQISVTLMSWVGFVYNLVFCKVLLDIFSEIDQKLLNFSTFILFAFC